MTDDPFNSPMARQAAALAGVPPEILHLRKMAQEADAEIREGQKRLAAILFAIRQHEILYAAERLNA